MGATKAETWSAFCRSPHEKWVVSWTRVGLTSVFVCFVLFEAAWACGATAAKAKEPTKEEVLLTEIRDLLKKK